MFSKNNESPKTSVKKLFLVFNQHELCSALFSLLWCIWRLIMCFILCCYFLSFTLRQHRSPGIHGNKALVILNLEGNTERIKMQLWGLSDMDKNNKKYFQSEEQHSTYMLEFLMKAAHEIWDKDFCCDYSSPLASSHKENGQRRKLDNEGCSHVSLQKYFNLLVLGYDTQTMMGERFILFNSVVPDDQTFCPWSTECVILKKVISSHCTTYDKKCLKCQVTIMSCTLHIWKRKEDLTQQCKDYTGTPSLNWCCFTLKAPKQVLLILVNDCCLHSLFPPTPI